MLIEDFYTIDVNKKNWQTLWNAQRCAADCWYRLRACLYLCLLFIKCEPSLITFGNGWEVRLIYHLITLSNHNVNNDYASHCSSLDNDKHNNDTVHLATRQQRISSAVAVEVDAAEALTRLRASVTTGTNHFR